MAGRKTLINMSGHELEVTLLVRQGDLPSATAGTVNVDLPASSDEDPGSATVNYGDDKNIYLNGLEVRMMVNGAAVKERRITLERGNDLDNTLNTNDTIEFLYDGQSILISGKNSISAPFSFAAKQGDATE